MQFLSDQEWDPLVSVQGLICGGYGGLCAAPTGHPVAERYQKLDGVV